MATPVLHIGPRSILPPALQPGPMPPARIKPASPRVAATPSAACAYQPGRLPNAWRFLTIYSLVRRVIMSEAAMTSKGQVAIPAEIPKDRGLVAGERVVFTQLADRSEEGREGNGSCRTCSRGGEPEQ